METNLVALLPPLVVTQSFELRHDSIGGKVTMATMVSEKLRPPSFGNSVDCNRTVGTHMDERKNTDASGCG